MKTKDIEEDNHEWKDVLFLWIGGSDVVKMPIVPKVLDTFSAIPTKIPKVFFLEIEQIIIKFVCTNSALLSLVSNYITKL